MQCLQSASKHFSTDRLKKPALCSYRGVPCNTEVERGGEESLSLVTGVVQYKLKYHLWPFAGARRGIGAAAPPDHCATQEFTYAGGLCQWLTTIDSELLYSAEVVQSSWSTGESWVLSCSAFSGISRHAYAKIISYFGLHWARSFREYVAENWVLIIVCYREGHSGSEPAWATASVANCFLAWQTNQGFLYTAK